MSKLNFTSEEFEKLFKIVDVLNEISLKSIYDLTGLDFDECYELIERYLNNRKRVNKNIFLRKLPITDLSQLEYVGGDLDLQESRIEDLSNLGYVNGMLNLWYSDIKKLPNLKYVDGLLDIRFTQIKELPNLEYVGGNLLLSYEDIDVSHIKVGRNIHR